MLTLRRCFLAFLILLGPGATAMAEYEDAPTITPPRLSYLDGEISFWRPGAEDWLGARLNTPIAVGDELYAGEEANFELQIDSRAFLRADEHTQLALDNHDPDYLQFRVASGRISLDLRRLEPGMTVELATPDAVFTIAHEGYYRLDVDADTRFVTRRGGRATVIPAGGRAMSIQPSEEIVVRGGNPVRVETYVAPELDQWDNWNYVRSDDLLDAVSARYLPSGVYGADELDRYGNWREVSEYGQVWIPDSVPSGWAPYSTGSWVWDPYYEWSWIDDAPWGWAPYHYGRWVFLNGYWAWAPGPVASRRAYYSPALVAFFSYGNDVSVRVGHGIPGLYWVSLGWGEPIVPWWGHSSFRGKPWWGGWHGPRIVNNVVVRDRARIDIGKILYRNARQARAVAYARQEHFGRPQERVRQADRFDVEQMVRLHGALPVRPGPESVAVGIREGKRPPARATARQVVVTRAPKEARVPWRNDSPLAKDAPRPTVRVMPSPKRDDPALRRPDFGTQGVEVRPRSPQPPRYREMPPPRATPSPRSAGEREGVGRSVPEMIRMEQARQAQPQVQQTPVAPVQPRVPVQTRVPLQTQVPLQPRIQQAQPIREMLPAQEIQPSRETPRVGTNRDIVRERIERDVPRQEPRSQERTQSEPFSLPGSPANRMYQRQGRGQ